jgi:hypothetical protein
MAGLSGEEIRRRLVELRDRWNDYSGSERAEAQTFLNDLFACFGTQRRDVATFEEPQEGRFMDCIWPRTCLIEMKRPSEAARLDRHRKQAFGYWTKAADAANSVPAPRFLVLCAFQRFEIWEPGAYPAAPRATIDLEQLPDRPDALLFLAGDEPVFLEPQEAVTREAVGQVTSLFDALRERRAAGPDVLRDFLLQCVWCMFAEDLGQLDGHLFTRLVDDLIANPRRSSHDDLGGLFKVLNDPAGPPEHGVYRGARYVNGGLFREPASVHLEPDELEQLRTACSYDWRRIEPAIFGSLLEGALGHDAQWALGAHYTHVEDIQKVVQPTIVRPWRERLAKVRTLKQAQALQHDLQGFTVLDPACGSGNFLYVAYRELRRIEADIRTREAELRRAGGGGEQPSLLTYFPLSNMRGIEIDPFAASLARVTLWMAHKLSVDELGLNEATLPLVDLTGVQVGDALRAPWPKARAIIGNPPFHGDRHLRELLGDDYIAWLGTRFNCGIKDHCVYWFRRAVEELQPGDRAGLVATNSVSQNRARSVSLNHIVEEGGVITDAIASQTWPGTANVEVSIVNWIAQPKTLPGHFTLDGEPAVGIDTALRESTVPVADVPVLGQNRGVAFQGCAAGAPYDIPVELANELLALGEQYGEVVRPFLGGKDLTQTPNAEPTRWTIYFGTRSLEDVQERWPAALQVVRERAKVERENARSWARNPRWWQFLWPRGDLMRAVSGRTRYLVMAQTGKRSLVGWAEASWVPSNVLNVFALSDDFHFAVLSSRTHVSWGLERGSSLRRDPRYTPTSSFETFPWPQTDDATRAKLAALGEQLHAARVDATKRAGGLTKVYNQMDEGGWEDLRRIHRKIDLAVVAAYGWDAAIADDDRARNQALYDLNADIVAGRRAYIAF